MGNIALMKIATYYKSQNIDVGWHMPLIDTNIDKLYISKIFDFTQDYQYSQGTKEVIKGGSGYDLTTVLSPEIDKITELDYSIYPHIDYSLQFYSRGCIRNCPFCIVPQKEGYIQSVEPMKLNPKGKHIEVLDNNFSLIPNGNMLPGICCG